MSTTLALESLFERVSASFAADGIQAANVFGWRQPATHIASGFARIAWVPGNTGGAVGETTAPRHPGSIPRPLLMLRELFTVYISAADNGAPESELAQYHITRMLRDAWLRAVYLAAHGTFRIRDEQWITDRRERRHGAAIRLVCEIEAPIVDALPDAPLVGTELPADVVDAHAVALEENTELAAANALALNDTDDPTD